jgi:2-polyprenyl-3-methyl-5-hydroxy-6-metoxy-1,4-benzoquinol methylase
MPETVKPTANAAQIEHWNAVAGKTWAQHQELLDRQIELLGLAVIDALAPTKGEHILDIGCGCGQSSLALADRVGATGSVIGVDVSAPMLEVALQLVVRESELGGDLPTDGRADGRSGGRSVRCGFLSFRSDVLR